MSHFNLPKGLTDGQRLKVKQFALKKMATQFQSWKKRLYSDYIKAKKKTPEFTGALEKIKDHWDAFVEYKESDEALERSRKNKINAAKKEYHHVLGTGGYKRAVPKWEAAEAKMLAEGVIPAIADWPERSKNWFYAHGGKFDPATGEIIEKASLKTASDALLQAIEDVQKGVFQPERENDELTRALKNPEYGGRTRGKGVVPWVQGFSEWNDTYRSRQRKKKQDADRLQKIETKNEELERMLKRQQEQLDTISQQRAFLRQEQADPALDSTVPSMR